MDQPVINAVIDGQDIVYRDSIDLSVAVASPKVCVRALSLPPFRPKALHLT